MPPAKTLRDAYHACDPRPLPSGDPYFVDLTKARGSTATLKLKQMIENCNPNQYSPIAFSGHRGCGKSTELRQLENVLREFCFTLYLDVQESLDPLDVDYTDLFPLVCRQLLDALGKVGVALSPNLLRGVENWFREVTKETEQSVELSAGVEAGAEARFEIPFVSKLWAKLTADVRTGSATKTTTRQKLDNEFSGLLANTNLLLASASEALQKAGRPCQLLILYDNLDRMPPEKSDRLFFDHGAQIQGMKCHAVYTVSIDTYYSGRGLGNVFPGRLILPNVKLRAGRSDVQANRAGMDGLRGVIDQRIDVSALLAPPSLAEEFVKLSGGSVRQLVRLLAEAVLSAQTRRLDAIDDEALHDAAGALRQDFERMLAPADYLALARTAKTKKIEKEDAYMHLLRNLAVLEYNGRELWHDVNPLIEPIHAFQELVKKRRSGRRPRSSRG